MVFGSVACKCVVTRPAIRSNNYSNLIVVLLGWAGCKDSYLAKYSAIYEQRGITTLRYTVRITNRAMRHAHVPARFTSPMVNALNELIASPARKILFHFFSMNSIFTLSSLLASCGPTLMDRAVAAIFDSTPAKYATTFGTVLDFTLPQQFPSAGPLMLAAIKYIVLRLNDINEYKNSILSAIDGKPERREIFYWAARRANLPKLQLYIYSRKDAVCHHEFVRIEYRSLYPQSSVHKRSIAAFREEQISRRGAKAFTMFCEDSEHVQHLRKYPDLYISTVNEFLNRVISQ